MSTTRMRQEIFEQPAALLRTAQRLRPLQSEIASLGDRVRHVLFIARGTSDNAAVYGQYLCTTSTGRLATLASPSVATAYRSRVDLTDVLAVAISQSGDTAEIVETQEWAKACGARTIAVTNHADSALASKCDLALVTSAGDEKAIPATKTYTTQLMALAVLAYSLAGNFEMLDKLQEVPAAAERMLEDAPVAEAVADTLRYADRVVVAARGYAATTALELALKLKEACYLPAIGLSSADLLHGPIAMVDSTTPVVLIAPPTDQAMLPGMTLLAERCSGMGARVYGIGGDSAFAAHCYARLLGPDLPAELAPIPSIIPGQLITEALARAKGINPDAPRGLRKVTQVDAQPVA